MKRSDYFKRALSVAWPAVLEFFFISIADIIDTFMVSGMGPSAVAAIGLTTQPKFIAMAAFISINAAVSALVARRQGEDNRKKANQTLVTALFITMLFVVIVDLIFIPFAPQIMRFAGSNSETHDYAVTYFRIIMAGIFSVAISTAINGAHRGAGNTQIAFITNVVSTLVNIFFNYLLIYGNLGFPRLGIAGAAIATVLGTIVSSIMCFISLYRGRSYLSYKVMIRDKIRVNKNIANEIFRLGSNIFVENISARIGFFVTAITAAGLGTNAFAAHNVGMNILSLTFAFGNGMQVAAISLTGNALGAGNKEAAMTYGKVSQQIGLMISVIISALLLIFGRLIYGLFFTDPVIIDFGQIIIRFLPFIVVFQISQVVFGGCLRAAGDVRFALYVALISVTFIRSIVTLIAVNIFDLGLAGIWIGILADQISRFVSLGYRFYQGKWLSMKI